MTRIVDVDVERIYVRMPKPLCLPQLITFTVLFLAKILRTKTRYDFQILATMPPKF